MRSFVSSLVFRLRTLPFLQFMFQRVVMEFPWLKEQNDDFWMKLQRFFEIASAVW